MSEDNSIESRIVPAAQQYGQSPGSEDAVLDECFTMILSTQDSSR